MQVQWLQTVRVVKRKPDRHNTVLVIQSEDFWAILSRVIVRGEIDISILIVTTCSHNVKPRRDDVLNVKHYSWSGHVASRGSKGMELILKLEHFRILNFTLETARNSRGREFRSGDTVPTTNT
jgi:hypothetical protein